MEWTFDLSLLTWKGGAWKVKKSEMAEAGEQEEVMAAQRTGRRDPYEVLEVPRDATEQQIKNAYRKLALK